MSNLETAAVWLGLAALLAAARPLPAQQCREGRAPTTVVRGVVTDRETGVPLQGAEVRASWQDGEQERSQSVRADSAGRYRMCDLPAGSRLQLRARFLAQGTPALATVPAGDSLELSLEVTAPHSVLRGRVVQDGAESPVADAAVRVVDTPLSTVTDADGNFAFAQIPPGSYQLRFEHLAFGTRTDTVTVELRSTVELVARVAERAIALPPLEVSVRSGHLADAGFYDRRSAGFGAFLVRQEWERQGPRLPSDLLRMVPGVRVVPSGSGVDNVILDRRNCRVRYFMDGARLGPTFRLDDIPVQWIEALEIYRGPAGVPAQFRGFPGTERGGCGVIVIWTRRTAH